MDCQLTRIQTTFLVHLDLMGFHKSAQYILCIIHSWKEIRAHQRSFLHQILPIGVSFTYIVQLVNPLSALHQTIQTRVLHHTIFALNRKDKPGAALAQKCIQSAAYKEKHTYIHLPSHSVSIHSIWPASQSFHFPTEPLTCLSSHTGTEQSSFLGGREECMCLPDMWEEFMTADSGPVTPKSSTVCLLMLKRVLNVSHVSEDRGAMHSFSSSAKEKCKRSAFRQTGFLDIWWEWKRWKWMSMEIKS